MPEPPASLPNICGSRQAAESTSPPWPQRTDSQPSCQADCARGSIHAHAHMHMHTSAQAHTGVRPGCTLSAQARGRVQPHSKIAMPVLHEGLSPRESSSGLGGESLADLTAGAQALQGGGELGSDQDQPLTCGQCLPGPAMLQS